MKTTDSEVIELISLQNNYTPAQMSSILESLLEAHEINQIIDPTFLDSEVEYIGCIEDMGATGNVLSQFDLCFRGLEVFSISSARDDGLVMLRKGDEMLIFTEHNAEVIQEEEMDKLMRLIETEIAKNLL